MKKFLLLSLALVGLLSGMELFGLKDQDIILFNAGPYTPDLNGGWVKVTIITESSICPRPLDDEGVAVGFMKVSTKCPLNDCIKKIIVKNYNTNIITDSHTEESKAGKLCNNHDIFIKIFNGKITEIQPLQLSSFLNRSFFDVNKEFFDYNVGGWKQELPKRIESFKKAENYYEKKDAALKILSPNLQKPLKFR